MIRAAAILLVMASHSDGNIAAIMPFLNVNKITLLAGVWGVELFFVLSGYLIGGILLNQVVGNHVTMDAIGRFLARRWLRTLPLYLLTLTGLVLWFGAPDGRYVQLAYYLTFSHWWVWRDPPMSWFGVSWSLAVEEWAYLLLAATMLLPPRANRRAVLLKILVLVMLPLIGRLWFVDYAASWDDQFRKTTPLRVDAIGIGVLLAWCGGQPRLLHWLRRPAALTAAAAVAGLCSVVVADPSLREGFFAKTLLFTLMPATVTILILLAEHACTKPSLSASVTKAVALWSYAAYLIHTPVFYGVDLMLDPGILNLLVGWTLVAAVSVLSYYCVEQPILKMRPAQ